MSASLDAEPVGDGQCGPQHGGGVPAAARTGADVVADVTADVAQELGELVADGNPAEVLVSVNPPQGRAGHVSGRPRCFGKRLRPQSPRVAVEGHRISPGRAVLADLATDHGGVVGNAAPLSLELRHGDEERGVDVAGRRVQLQARPESISRHPSISAALRCGR